MSNEMKMELLNQIVTISEQTEYCMHMHNNFCSHGQEWLLKHDPDGEREYELIEAAKSAFADDFEESIKDLTDELRDELSEDFNNLDDMDYWWELRDAVSLDEGDQNDKK